MTCHTDGKLPADFRLRDAFFILGGATILFLAWAPLYSRAISPLIAAAVGDPTAAAWSLLFLFDFPLMAVLVIYLRRKRLLNAGTLGIRSQEPLGEVLYGATWFLLFLLISAVAIVISWYMSPGEFEATLAREESRSAPMLLRRIADSANAITIVCAIFITGVLSPIVEEVYFRGLLYRSLRRTRGMGASMAVSSGIFAVVHLGAGLFYLMLYLCMGAVLAYMLERRGSLLPCVTFHCMQNILVTLLNFLAI